MSASWDRSQKIGFSFKNFHALYKNPRVLKTGSLEEKSVEVYGFKPLESPVAIQKNPVENQTQPQKLKETLEKIVDHQRKLKALLEELHQILPKKK